MADKRRYALAQTYGIWSVAYEDGNRVSFDRSLYRTSTSRARSGVVLFGPDDTELFWQSETSLGATSRDDLLLKLDQLQAGVAAGEVLGAAPVQLHPIEVKWGGLNFQWEWRTIDGSTRAAVGSDAWRINTNRNMVYKSQNVTPTFSDLWIDSSIGFLVQGSREHLICVVDGVWYDIMCINTAPTTMIRILRL